MIASIARNIADTFDLDYQRISSSFSDYEIVKWIIIESNSDDNSAFILKNSQENRKLFIMSQLKAQTNTFLIVLKNWLMPETAI